MSLLFNRPKSLEVKSSLKADPAKGGLETVLVGSQTWEKLLPTPDAKAGYKCVSVRSLNSVQDSALVAWAVLDDEIDGIAIPPSWIHEHSRVFHRNGPGSSLLKIASTEPVLLSEVVVSALTQESYDVARHSNLKARLTAEHTILRHGSILSLDQSSMLVNGNGHNGPSKTYRYRLNMLEPVLQGYAQKDVTQFIITAPLPGEEDTEEDDQEETADFHFNEDEVEIGEDFLASSVISPPLALSTTPELDHEADGHGQGTSQDQGTQSTGLHLESRPLRRPPSQKADENTVYVRTSDLGKLGLLNGDWGMARSSHRSTGRLVRVVADDKVVPSSGLVFGSPVLLHNICSKGIDTPRSEPATISLFPSPFGSQQPTIPTARTVTLARVASPFSVNKKYQAAFLNALKAYFSQGRKLVKQGDIIAVGIDTNNLPVENTDAESSNESEVHSLSGFPASVNETVFFCVTNVEHDVIKTNASPDVYVSATIGELGCWIEADETRMMQTGIEHCLVPDVTSYTSSRGATLPILRGLGTFNLLGPDSNYHKMLELVSAALGNKAVDYNLELSMLLKGARGIGKFTTLSWIAQDLGMHLLEVNCYDLIGENDTKSEASLRFQFEKAQDCSPCILVLRHLEAFVQSTQPLEPGKEPVLTKALQECIQETPKGWKMTGYPVITVGTASEPGRIPAGILALFKHEISFEAPGEGARLEMLQCLVDNTTLAPDVALGEIATHTAALVAADIVDLMSRAHTASIERVFRTGNAALPPLVDAGVALNAEDFDVALGKARAAYSDSIGAPKIPNVSWDDVGGLANVKSEILDTIQLPLDHPELFADGLKKRSGILLYGPPGTGKTLLAKAVATSCSLNFFSVKGPELLNMYIGESEANVRRVFQRARDAKPCVVFFDELDSIAPKRGNQGDSGGVMDRIVSQLLAEIDGMSSGSGSSDVFVIGATNRPDLLDPALLRPGRFDRMLYLGVSDTHEAQANILRALTRKFRLHPDLDLDEVAEQCPFNYTGADFYALCSDAMLNAMSRKAELIDEKIAALKASGGHPHTLTPQYYLAEMATPEDIEVLVTREDFDRALKALVPSVSQAEMDHYARVRDEFSKDKKKEENTTH